MRFPTALCLAITICCAAEASQAKGYDSHIYDLPIQDDKFSSSATIVGRPEGTFKLLGTSRNWKLRSWIEKKTLTVSHQIYVDIQYDGAWKFYEAAADDNANSLVFTVISGDVEDCNGGFLGCTYSEVVGVDVGDEMMRRRALTGFQVKLSAKSGDSLILDITPAQIQSQLLAVNKALPPDRWWSAATPFGKGGAPSNERSAQSQVGPSQGSISTAIQLAAAKPGRFGVVVADFPGANAGSPAMKQFRSAYGMENVTGAIVVVVTADSIAAKAGLIVGDVIEQFGDTPIKAMHDLGAATAVAPGGKAITLRVVRLGRPLTLSAQF